MHTEQEREIFRFSRVGKQVCADPDVIRRTLLVETKGDDLQTLIDQLEGDVEELAAKAHERLLPAIQKAFKMAPLDEEGSGCTEREMFGTFFDFCRFMADLKKKGGDLPKCSEPTEESSSATEPSPTPSTTAFSSTDAA